MYTRVCNTMFINFSFVHTRHDIKCNRIGKCLCHSYELNSTKLHYEFIN